MKKTLFALIGLTLTLSMVLGILAGCGGGATPKTTATTPGSTSTSTSTSTTTTKPTVTPTKAGEVVSWRFQTGTAAGAPTYFLWKRFADEVKIASGGRFIIEVFPAGAIVASTELMDAAISGAAEMTGGLSNQNWSGKDERFYLAGNLGGAFTTSVNFCATWYEGPDGETLPIQKYMAQLFDDIGVIHLPGNTGYRYPEAEYMASKPLIKPADFKGLTFRGVGWSTKVAVEFGAKGVFVPGTDVYSALQTGVIDAAELGDVYSNYAQGYYDICKYTGFPGIHALCENSDIMVSKAAWAKLPDDLRKILFLCCEDFSNHIGAYSNVKSAQLVSSGELQKKGVTIIYESPEMQDLWRSTSWKLADDIAVKNPKFKEWWDAYTDFQITMDRYLDLQTPDYGPDYNGNKEKIPGIRWE